MLFIDCAAAGGYYFDLNGGTATATTLRADGLSIDQWHRALAGAGDGAQLGHLQHAGTAIAPIKLVVDGFIAVNSGGTFIPRFALCQQLGHRLHCQGRQLHATALLN